MAFRTWVRCEGILCNLIIDCGFEINFVMQEVIHKLQLSTEKLWKPYRVAWVDDFIIPITQHCLVSFKICTYEDDIWCDLIPMNVTRKSSWTTIALASRCAH